MARGVWIYDKTTGTMRPKGEVLRERALAAPERSSFPRPLVIGTMDPIRSMADGRIYDDKSSYYKSVARAGCEIVGYDRNFQDHIDRRAGELAVERDKSLEADIVSDVKQAIAIETAK